MSSCGDDLLAGLVELPHGLRGRLAATARWRHPPGAVVAPVRVPGDLLHVDAVLAEPASTTSASDGPLSEVFSRVRRACWASIARSCTPGRRSAAPGPPGRRDAGTSSADSPERMRAWMSRGASSMAAISIGASGGCWSGRSALRTRSSMGARAAADLVGEHERLAVLREGDKRTGRIACLRPTRMGTSFRHHSVTVRVTLAGTKHAAPTESKDGKQMRTPATRANAAKPVAGIRTLRLRSAR